MEQNTAITVLNFGHPLTPAQRDDIERLSGAAIARVIDSQAQFDPSQPFIGQAVALVESAGLSGAEWQTAPLVANLPTHHVIAAVTLAELHGRIGYFPAVLRLRLKSDAGPPQFEVAEILNLQSVRDEARRRRTVV